MLCDQIIQQQRGLVKEHALPVPEELDELYDLYLQLNDAGEMSAGTPTQVVIVMIIMILIIIMIMIMIMMKMMMISSNLVG